MRGVWACSAIGAIMIACSASSTGGDTGSDAGTARSPTHPPPLVQTPIIQCVTGDAGRGGDVCSSPPSVCADADWLAYFDGGQCVGGRCVLVTKYYFCTGGCRDGSCASNRPTAPSRFG